MSLNLVVEVVDHRREMWLEDLSGGLHPLCIFGGPDGWCYAFAPEPTKDDEGYPVLKEVWRFDCNLPEYRVHGGKPARYATRGGPSEVIATPMVYKDRVYVAIGQDPNPLLNRASYDLDRSGRIFVDDETAETNLAGVYAGGDAVAGTAGTVIYAAGCGLRAAQSIHGRLTAVCT